MKRAIYVLGDDRVCDQVVTLCYSARRAGETSDLRLIPYSDSYERCLEAGERFGLGLVPVDLVAEIDGYVEHHLAGWPLRHPKRLRALAAWLADADAFVYLDADILLFRALDEVFVALEDHQFVACDYQWRSGFQYVFEPVAAARAGLAPDDVFNSGFWGSRRDALSRAGLEGWFSRLPQMRSLFDLSGGTNDQPLLNHLIAASGWRFLNLTRQQGTEGDREPGSWAGSSGFQRRGDILYDRDSPQRYLHWAGYRLDAAAPYGDLWADYRSAALAPPSST